MADDDAPLTAEHNEPSVDDGMIDKIKAEDDDDLDAVFNNHIDDDLQSGDTADVAASTGKRKRAPPSGPGAAIKKQKQKAADAQFAAKRQAKGLQPQINYAVWAILSGHSIEPLTTKAKLHRDNFWYAECFDNVDKLIDLIKKSKGAIVKSKVYKNFVKKLDKDVDDFHDLLQQLLVDLDAA